MKITKFVHSCLLVECPDLSILIDPGKFTADSHLLHIGSLDRLDYIVLTHEHLDHYDINYLHVLTQQLPHAKIIAPQDLAQKIITSGITNQVSSASEQNIELFEAPHEPLPLNLPSPSNIGIHIENKLTHPGDAWVIPSSKEILALPVTAPWGSLKQALDIAVKFNPKVIIPIHDWHWHRAARDSMYRMSIQLLKPRGINFLALENGIPVEL